MRRHERCSVGSPYVAAAILLVLATAACGNVERTSAGAAPAEVAGSPSGAAAAALDLEPTEEMLAALRGADRVDGAEDRIVSRCPGCGLAMEGTAEHTLEIGDYELHFCSATCQEHFEKNPVAGIESLREDAGVEGGS